MFSSLHLSFFFFRYFFSFTGHLFIWFIFLSLVLRIADSFFFRTIFFTVSFFLIFVFFLSLSFMHCFVLCFFFLLYSFFLSFLHWFVLYFFFFFSFVLSLSVSSLYHHSSPTKQNLSNPSPLSSISLIFPTSWPTIFVKLPTLSVKEIL